MYADFFGWGQHHLMSYGISSLTTTYDAIKFRKLQFEINIRKGWKVCLANLCTNLTAETAKIVK